MNADIEEAAEVLHVQGEMSIYRAIELAHLLLPAIGNPAKDVRMDLSRVTEFDTAGLQILLMARRVAASGGQRLRVVQASECVRQVLALCDLADLCDTPADSLA